MWSVCPHAYVCTCPCVHVNMHCVCTCTVFVACVCEHAPWSCMCRCACVPACRCVRGSLTRSCPPQSAVECSASLRALHSLELGHLRRSLALQKEEDFAKARRQLAVFQRSELHNIFFAQIKNAIFKGELKPEAAKMLLQDYCIVQVMPALGLAARGAWFSGRFQCVPPPERSPVSSSVPRTGALTCPSFCPSLCA